MGLKELLDVTAAGVLSADEAQATLERGRALLQAGERERAAVELRRAAMAPSTQLAAHNLIEAAGLQGAFSEWMGLDASIDPADDVFGFFNGYGSWSSPLRDYLADGWRTLSELLLLLERCGCPLTGFGAVLEFASGHGRFTRHLARAVGAERVTVSDVVPGAVDFSRRHFGVQGFVASAEPQIMRWPGRFDLVFVLSLFTHLPKSTWLPWLQRIWDAVEPGGVLVFTTHGEQAIARAGVPVDDSGFHFRPESESTTIDAAQYGVTYTTRAFVQAQLARLQPHVQLVDFTPAWFWNHQDAFVLQRASAGSAVA